VWFQEERKDHKDATQKKTSGGEDTPRAEARQNLCRVGSPVEKVEARWFTNT